MLELAIRPRAARDLKDIWAYTAQQWGAVQADQYLHDIDREIQGLLKFPEMGVPCDSVRTNYRALHVKSHLVFYLHKGQRLEIVRVLHESMNVKSHL
jgi:toxin ParE1/3/4